MHGACDTTRNLPRGDELPALVDRGGLIVLLDGADASVAERIAGAGVVRRRQGDGVALRAGREGVPTWIDGRIEILPSHVEGDVDGSLERMGDLSVTGAVRAGATVRASGAVVVGGAVERATVGAGASLSIAGRATRAELSAGWTAGVAESLRQALAGVAPALAEIAASARLAGRDRGRRMQSIHDTRQRTPWPCGSRSPTTLRCCTIAAPTVCRGHDTGEACLGRQFVTAPVACLPRLRSRAMFKLGSSPSGAR